MRNTIQILGLCLANVCLMIFGASQPRQIQDAVEHLNIQVQHPDIYKKLIPIEIAIPCILAGGTIIMSFLAWKLYGEFSWSIYKHISADLQMKRRYLTYQVCLDLCFHTSH